MSKPVHKALIGVFVVGAAAMVLAAVLVFGSGKFFTPVKKFVVFFEGSVKGLSVGAPVIFRGVKIGEVTEIRLVVNPKDMSAVIPVYINIDPRSFAVPEEFKALLKETDKKYVYIKRLVEKGLKAQLQMQSFVTGQLVINLDFYPDKPIKLVGRDEKVPEIPTVPTPLEELSKTIQDLPLREIVTKLDLAMDGLQKLVNSPDTKESLKSLQFTLEETGKLVKNINEKIDPLMSNLNKLTENAQDSLTQAKSTMSELEGDAKELVSTTRKTLESAQAALNQSERTLATFSGDSRLVHEMGKTLKELSMAARSVRILTEYLERHPESLLRGKHNQEGASK